MTVTVYDDEYQRLEELDRWHPYNSTLNRQEGRHALKVIQRQLAAADRARRPRMSVRAGVPDACLFRKGDTMAGHLAGLRWMIWLDPDTDYRTTVWRLA